jgi:methylmalonyl-CoA/ethylmalonyl-CoA epimerase
MIKKVHHVGIVVRNLEEGYRFYRDVLGLPLHKERTIEEQGVRAALLTLGDSEIELLEPIDPQGGVARFLERRGGGLHHICFETDDIESELAGLKERGVELIDQQPRLGLAGLICFLHPRAHRGVLVELAQPVEQEEHAEHVTTLKRLDHVAVAVRELEETAQAWERNLGLKRERVFQPAGSDVRLASLPAGNAFVELAQPLTSDHFLAAFMDEQGEGMFSLAIEVGDLEAAVAELRGRGAQVSDPEPGLWEKTRLAHISRESGHGVAVVLVQRQ